MLCLNCSCETTNPKFCNKSCAAKFNNTKFPKRKQEKYPCSVKDCISVRKSSRNKLCSIHFEEYVNRSSQYKDKSVGEYRNLESVKGKHPSWINSHVRSFARSWLVHLTKLPCAHCGYSKHVELAHIKPVSSFPDSALLSEINSETNVIQLCPNCHWEFDNLPR